MPVREVGSAVGCMGLAGYQATIIWFGRGRLISERLDGSACRLAVIAAASQVIGSMGASHLKFIGGKLAPKHSRDMPTNFTASRGHGKGILCSHCCSPYPNGQWKTSWSSVRHTSWLCLAQEPPWLGPARLAAVGHKLRSLTTTTTAQTSEKGLEKNSKVCVCCCGGGG